MGEEDRAAQNGDQGHTACQGHAVTETWGSSPHRQESSSSQHSSGCLCLCQGVGSCQPWLPLRTQVSVSTSSEVSPPGLHPTPAPRGESWGQAPPSSRFLSSCCFFPSGTHWSETLEKRGGWRVEGDPQPCWEVVITDLCGDISRVFLEVSGGTQCMQFKTGPSWDPFPRQPCLCGLSGPGGWAGCRVEEEPAQPHGTCPAGGNRCLGPEFAGSCPRHGLSPGWLCQPPSQSGTRWEDAARCWASKQGFETWAQLADKMTAHRRPPGGEGREECRRRLGQVVGFGTGATFPFTLCWIYRISYSEDENFLKVYEGSHLVAPLKKISSVDLTRGGLGAASFCDPL